MKCAKVQLQERVNPVVQQQNRRVDKPRRYCQKRMVNPERDEDDVMDTFCYKTPYSCCEKYKEMGESLSPNKEEDLYLTIQNLKFQGNTQERKRPRIYFKYKSMTDYKKHRMFVKQAIDNCSEFEDDKLSELSNNFFDDYLKYFLNTDRSRPSSSKSTVFIQDLSNKITQKPVQINKDKFKKSHANDIKKKTSTLKISKQRVKEELENNVDTDIMDNAKIAYNTSEKRKNLTISRIPSPETVQVIRVDVVRNCNTGSTTSNTEQNISTKNVNIVKVSNKNTRLSDMHFSDKYLLTKTVTGVSENLSCGSKVTLLCKTFKLADRVNFADRHNPIVRMLKNEKH
ncbi:hypothetical protein ACJJTC_000614 [Scirpophaga incertulas]